MAKGNGQDGKGVVKMPLRYRGGYTLWLISSDLAQSSLVYSTLGQEVRLSLSYGNCLLPFNVFPSIEVLAPSIRNLLHPDIHLAVPFRP